MALIKNQPTSELETLVHQLGGTWTGDFAKCRCPAHPHRAPSLSIRQGGRGILVTCHAGCDRGDVLRELYRIATIPNFTREAITRSSRGTG